MAGIRWHATHRGLFTALPMLATGAAAPASELIVHNGFEQCWSKALTVPQYAALAPSLEGVQGCIPETGDASSTTHFCYATTCPGGAKGCPVTFRGGQSTFSASQSRFDASSGIQPFSTLATLPFAGECTVNFVDTSTVVYQYPVNILTVADGNNGRYIDWLALGDVTVSGLTGNDVSVGGSFACQSANFGLAVFVSMLAAAKPSIEDVYRGSSLLDQTVCPYP